MNIQALEEQRDVRIPIASFSDVVTDMPLQEQQAELDSLKAQFTAAEERHQAQMTDFPTLTEQRKALEDQIQECTDLSNRIHVSFLSLAERPYSSDVIPRYIRSD